MRHPVVALGALSKLPVPQISTSVIPDARASKRLVLPECRGLPNLPNRHFRSHSYDQSAHKQTAGNGRRRQRQRKGSRVGTHDWRETRPTHLDGLIMSARRRLPLFPISRLLELYGRFFARPTAVPPKCNDVNFFLHC
jgi:hypothetical protein